MNHWYKPFYYGARTIQQTIVVHPTINCDFTAFIQVKLLSGLLMKRNAARNNNNQIFPFLKMAILSLSHEPNYLQLMECLNSSKRAIKQLHFRNRNKSVIKIAFASKKPLERMKNDYWFVRFRLCNRAIKNTRKSSFIWF